MNKLTKEEFYVLSTEEQVKYINELSNEYSHGDWVKYDKDNNEYIDVDSFEVIEDLYEYLNDAHCDYEGCDLYQKCFKE
jgi:hypothetical protein